MQHRNIPADHGYRLNHAAMQIIGHCLQPQPAAQISQDAHKHQHPCKPVCGFRHHPPLSLPHALGAVQQQHDTALQQVLRHNGKYKIGSQPPALCMEYHPAVPNDKKVQNHLYRQSLKMCIQQHLLRPNRRREQKMHITVAVNHPFPFGKGD